jgi:hypothetical protein
VVPPRKPDFQTAGDADTDQPGTGVVLLFVQIVEAIV